MRIGLLSDTHGILDLALKAVQAMGSIDLLIHCGDHYRDASKISATINVPVHAVVGNCGPRMDGPAEKLLEVEGVIIYITRGHRFNVKVSLYGLYNRSLELNAGVVVYGHTHIPGYGFTRSPGSPDKDDLLIINPGSISDPRGGSKFSYGILDIHGGVITPEVHYI